MEEVWKKIDGAPGDYEISSFGNCRNKRGKLLKPIKIAGQKFLCYQFQCKGKRTFRQIHNLIADAFHPESRLPIIYSVNTGERKRGRPTRSAQRHIKYKPYKIKKVVFLDGNPDNLVAANIKHREPDNLTTRATNPKYANVFYTGEPLIKLIENNTTDLNREDNEIIIKWLRGDHNAIGRLFTKYYAYHKQTLSIFIKRNSTKFGKAKRKENALELDDFIVESQIKLMGKVKKGRFDGRDFKNWSSKLVEKYLVQYFAIQKKKSEWLQDKTQTFIS